MPSHVGFNLSRIIIVESLKDVDVKTGDQIARFVCSNEKLCALGVLVEHHHCESAEDFIAIVSKLKFDAIEKKSIPLLHVECHGEENIGLEFRDRTSLSWSRLSELLVELNMATRFNLVAIFSACYGGHFLSQMSTINPAPCYAMLAPTESVGPHEILRAFREFYSELFMNMDAGIAMTTVSKIPLEDGRWMPILAESWYENVAISFIRQFCTRQEIRNRALTITNELRAKGINSNIGHIKQRLIQENRYNVTTNFFKQYFMIEDVPENATRFAQTKNRLEKRIQEFRATGRFGV